jgi:hypothetical protein
VWDFEDNMNSNTGLTFSLDSAPSSYGYATGKIGSKCLEFVASSNRGWKLTNPGSRFRLTWDIPWCWSFWMNTSGTNGPNIILSSTSGSSSSTNSIFELHCIATQQRFFNYYTAGSTTPNESYSPTFTSLGTNTWNFYYWRYDPSEPKKLYVGRNAETELSNTFTNDFESTAYSSSWTLGIGRYGGTGGVTVKLDQLCFHHTAARSRSDMLAIYNSGNGITL